MRLNFGCGVMSFELVEEHEEMHKIARRAELSNRGDAKGARPTRRASKLLEEESILYLFKEL